MTDHRTERISEALREELSELVSYELTDPRVALATVTDVLVSPDKKHAFVRIGIPSDADKQQTLAALEHARTFLRRELAFRLGLFRVPELHFESDIATDLGGRMDYLLKRVKKGRPRE
jgi:ribosome-binding factor A